MVLQQNFKGAPEITTTYLFKHEPFLVRAKGGGGGGGGGG